MTEAGKSESLGFRDLTAANVLEPDPVSSTWILPNRETGEGHEKTAQHWAEEILSVDLESHVPIQIRREFIVARAPLLYGFFFYALYALGLGQVFRVLESAAANVAISLSCPRSIHKFKDRIDWLQERGFLSANEADHWHVARNLRNRFAHPDPPIAILPTVVIDELESAARDIKGLFARLANEHTV